jgi:hypothetical protein
MRRRRCGYADRVLPGSSRELQEAEADEFVTEFPKNAYGQVLRRDLRDRFNWRH